MNRLKSVFGIGILTVLILSACTTSGAIENPVADPAVSSQETDNNDNAGTQESIPEVDENIKPTDSLESQDDQQDPEESKIDSAQDEVSPPISWMSHEFTDALTGEPFSIDQFQGRVILIEMVTFRCRDCLQQQEQIKELHALLGERDEFVSVVINIDVEEDPLLGTMFAEFHGFDWYYGDAPVEVVASIGSSLGGRYLDAASLPMVIIDKTGRVNALPFGLKSAEVLLSLVEIYLN